MQVIPVINLLTTHGQITLGEVRVHATTNWHGQQTRNAQNAEMLYHFLYGSLVETFKAKILLRSEDFKINQVPDGVLLLKVIILETFIDTRATAGQIRLSLANIDLELKNLNGNVQEFNEWIKTQCAILTSRGEQAHDLITYLWKAYLSSPDSRFIYYIESLQNNYNDGSADYSADQLMSLAENMYKTRVQTKVWAKLSEEQEEIVALNAKITAMETKATKSVKVNSPSKKSGDKEDRNKNQNKNNRGWIKEKPKGDELKADNYFYKNVNKKKYYWCKYHNQGEGQWVIHHPNDCRNKEEEIKDEIGMTAFDTVDSDDE